MTQSEMEKWLWAEITLSGAININLPDAEIKRIINNELDTIYQLDPRSTEKKFTILPVRLFHTESFRATRTIEFPECVFEVSKFLEANGTRGTLLGSFDPAFSLEKMFASNIFCGPTGVNLDSTLLWTINMSVADQLRNFLLCDITRDWSPLTHRLTVLGHTPRFDVYCELWTKVPATNIYDDQYCRKWIAARAKMGVSRMLNTFTVSSLGGVTVNIDSWTKSADEDMTDCKEYWKSLREANHFFITAP